MMTFEYYGLPARLLIELDIGNSKIQVPLEAQAGRVAGRADLIDFRLIVRDNGPNGIAIANAIDSAELRGFGV